MAEEQDLCNLGKNIKTIVCNDYVLFYQKLEPECKPSNGILTLF